ncbi:hypothetical protein TNCV_3844691 [Trichonephila clavipes]|nr:hypothetical protein TNCV_3844691 [Trichonephila clavipes]
MLRSPLESFSISKEANPKDTNGKRIAALSIDARRKISLRRAFQPCIGEGRGSAPGIPCLGLNSICSLRQKAVANDKIHAVPHKPFGESIIQPVTLTLGIHSRISLPHKRTALLFHLSSSQSICVKEQKNGRPSKGVSLP